MEKHPVPSFPAAPAPLAPVALMPEAHIDGRRLSWRAAGAGPPVLLAHCSLGHSGLWKGVMAGLDGFAATAVDLPAHGRTDPPPPGVSLALQGVADCRWQAERLGGRVHLVGLSLGAAVLTRLTLARPDLVASLTLIEPPLFYLLAGTPAAAEFALSEAMFAPVRAALDEGDFGLAVDRFIAAWGAPDGTGRMDPATRAALAAAMVPLAEDLPLMEGRVPPFLTLADFARLTCPVQLIEGGETKSPARAVLAAIAGVLPGACRHVVPGAGHIVPHAKPAETARLIADFLKDIAP